MVRAKKHQLEQNRGMDQKGKLIQRAMKMDWHQAQGKLTTIEAPYQKIDLLKLKNLFEHPIIPT